MAKKGPICPLMRKPCIEHECGWYAHMTGMDPQSGRDIDHWDCAVKWLPVLITEQARQTRGVQAAVETFRNEAGEQAKANAEQLRGAANMAAMIDAVARQSTQLPSLPQRAPQVLPYVDSENG